MLPWVIRQRDKSESEECWMFIILLGDPGLSPLHSMWNHCTRLSANVFVCVMHALHSTEGTVEENCSLSHYPIQKDTHIHLLLWHMKQSPWHHKELSPTLRVWPGNFKVWEMLWQSYSENIPFALPLPKGWHFLFFFFCFHTAETCFKGDNQRLIPSLFN